MASRRRASTKNLHQQNEQQQQQQPEDSQQLPPKADASHAPLDRKKKNSLSNRQLRDSIIGRTTSAEDEKDEKKDENKKPQTSPSLPLLTFPDASFLDASLVPDLWTLRLAAFAAEAAGRRGRARSRSRHTELVVALSGGKNVREWIFLLFLFLSLSLSFFSLAQRKKNSISSSLNPLSSL